METISKISGYVFLICSVLIIGTTIGKIYELGFTSDRLLIITGYSSAVIYYFGSYFNR